MAREFVVVRFPVVRDVRMDGDVEGQVGEILRVERGHHIFDLGRPRDYVPDEREENVIGTSFEDPMEIDFEPATDQPLAVPAAARRGARRGMKRPVKRAAKKRGARRSTKKAPRAMAARPAGKGNTARKKTPPRRAPKRKK